MWTVCSRRSARGNSERSAVRKSRRVAAGALAKRRRQTRTMLEARALLPIPIVRLPSFSAHRPRAGDRQAGSDDGVQKSLPTGASRSRLSPSRLRLLERIVDGHRKPRMCLVRESRRIAKVMPSRKKVSAASLLLWRYGVATNSSALGTARVANSSGKQPASGNGGARRRKSPKGQRRRCCRNTAGL